MAVVTSSITSTSRYKEYTVVKFKILVDGVAVASAQNNPDDPIVDKEFGLQVQDGIDVNAELVRYLQTYKDSLVSVPPQNVQDATV